MSRDEKNPSNLEDSNDANDEEKWTSESRDERRAKKAAKMQKQKSENLQGMEIKSETTPISVEGETESVAGLDLKKGKKKSKKRRHEIPADKCGDATESKASPSHFPTRGNYLEHPSTATMSSSEVESFRREAGIVVHPEAEATLWRPVTHFFFLFPSVETYCREAKTYIEMKNFTAPSPIQVLCFHSFDFNPLNPFLQAQCWPPLLAGRCCGLWPS